MIKYGVNFNLGSWVLNVSLFFIDDDDEEGLSNEEDDEEVGIN